MAGYAQVHRAFVRQLFAKLRPETARDALALLAWLAVEACWKSGGVEETDAGIGQALGMAECRARRLRRILVEVGAVRVARRGRGGGCCGKATSQRLVLLEPPGEPPGEAPGEPPGKAAGSKAGRGSRKKSRAERDTRDDSPEGTPESSLLKKEEGRREQETLFEVETCLEKGCPEQAVKDGRCLFCAEVWPMYEKARKHRGAGGSSRKASRAAWVAACKRERAPVILDALRAFCAVHMSFRGSGFLPMPHLTTWLNQDRWEIDPPKISANYGQQRDTSNEGGRDPSLDEQLEKTWRKRADEKEAF